jgi:hypothetical protein
MANPAIETDFKIATYASGTGGLVTLRSLSIPNPHPIWKEGVSKIGLGDNSSRLLGAPTVTWMWGFVQATWRDTLRGYCTGASAHVYIITPTTEKVGGVSNAAKTYDCQMWWPSPEIAEDPNAGRRLEFAITFKQLVIVP